MPRWKARGYVVQLYSTDHPPRHVHVFKDGLLVARFDLDHGCFMPGSDRHHFGRVRRALMEIRLLRGGH